MEFHRLHAVVHGRVQGVGFRFFVLQSAAAQGVSGWVRNRLDDSVELFAEGDRPVLEQFLEQIRQGPPGSRVDRVEVEWLPAEGGFTGFSIRPTA
jgi:acylphosphatase